MKIIAHRSGPTVYPEQTIHSAREALRLGADMVEIDVRMTQDKRIAISHDQNLSRVFGIDLNVNDITAEQFLAQRHQADRSFSSHLLEDYLRCGIFPLLIHVKETAAIAPMLQLIDQYGCAEKVTLGVADVASVQQIRAHDARIGILSFAKHVEDTESFIAAGVNYVRLWEGWLNEERVQLVKNSPAQLWLMSGHTEGAPVGEPSDEGLQKILSFQPDGVLINDIRRLK